MDVIKIKGLSLRQFLLYVTTSKCFTGKAIKYMWPNT